MSSKTSASGLQGRASGRAGRRRGQRNEPGTASASGSRLFGMGFDESSSGEAAILEGRRAAAETVSGMSTYLCIGKSR